MSDYVADNYNVEKYKEVLRNFEVIYKSCLSRV
jgi:hypothetical protein